MENYLTPIKSIVSKLQTNKIFVIGKGSTSGNINSEVYKDAIVININDSERIYPGQFCLVHSLWAHESIKMNGSKSECYFSSRESDHESHWFRLRYEPETFEAPEKIISILKDTELSINDFLFISAAKLSICIQEISGIKMDVYYVGFDFDSDQSNSIVDYSSHLPDYTNTVLKTQEGVFKTMKKYFRSTNEINILHVGNKAYSDIALETMSSVLITYSLDESISRNNQLYINLINDVKKGKPIIVAELTNNHIGDEFRLRTMVKLATSSGANAIKVQKRDVESFYTEDELNSPYESPFGKTLRDYRFGVELNDYLFKVLIEECTRNNIFWFLSILDYESFKYVEKYNLPLLKLPSTISKHKNFLLKVGSEYKGDLVISTGFTDIEYENFVLDNFLNDRRLFLLQCTSSYPAPPESCQISVVRHYNNLKVQKYTNLIPGYSSHDIGSLGCSMALSAGALMIEKHVKLGNLDWIHFDGVALDLSNGQFKDFILDIRRAQIMCGTTIKEIHSAEHHKYEPNEQSN
jgi:sialic acid synthase SpsE